MSTTIADDCGRFLAIPDLHLNTEEPPVGSEVWSESSYQRSNYGEPPNRSHLVEGPPLVFGGGNEMGHHFLTKGSPRAVARV